MKINYEKREKRRGDGFPVGAPAGRARSEKGRTAEYPPQIGKGAPRSVDLWSAPSRRRRVTELEDARTGRSTLREPRFPQCGPACAGSSMAWKNNPIVFHGVVPPPKSKVGDNGFAARLRRRRTLRANAQRLRLGPQKVPLRQHSELRFQIDSQTDPFLAFLLRLSPPFWLCGTSRRRHGRRSIPLFSAA